MTYYIWPWLPMSHTMSFCFTAIYIYCYRKYSTNYLTALAAGLMIIMRWQNALFLLPQIYANIKELIVTLKDKKFEKFQGIATRNLFFSFIIVLVFYPQAYTWKKFMGHFLLYHKSWIMQGVMGLFSFLLNY